ncbi:transposable element Tc1 transposase [Trichonephila clavipes]|nr:transposable element Tc1 transposase [Trichonephila clavipes]
MDDNAWPHQTLAVEELLEREDITRMDWPAKSPDLNSIEHLWDALGRRIAAPLHYPENTQQLKQMLIEEWALLPQEMLHQLVLTSACQLIYRYSSRKRKRRPASFQAKKCVTPNHVRLTSVGNRMPQRWFPTIDDVGNVAERDKKEDPIHEQESLHQVHLTFPRNSVTHQVLLSIQLSQGNAPAVQKMSRRSKQRAGTGKERLYHLQKGHTTQVTASKSRQGCLKGPGSPSLET